MRLEQEMNTHKLHMRGSLTIQDVEEVHCEYLQRFAEWHDVVLDLSQVEQCDAAGVQWLLCLHQSMSAAGNSIIVASLSQAVTKAARSIGVELFASLPSALSASEQEPAHAE